MKILLVYPTTPETFWSFKHVLRFVSKRASIPPLGLLTIGALLPAEWQVRLVDQNVDRLTDNDLRWADYVMLSAMIVHKTSVSEIINRCRRAGTPIIAGGPLFTTGMRPFRISTISCWARPKKLCHRSSKTFAGVRSATRTVHRIGPTSHVCRRLVGI